MFETWSFQGIKNAEESGNKFTPFLSLKLEICLNLYAFNMSVAGRNQPKRQLQKPKASLVKGLAQSKLILTKTSKTGQFGL